MRSAIDRYLDELAGRLPLPAHRLLLETRDHLVEARDAFIADGMPVEEAERRAVSELGDVSEVAAAVSQDGGPMFSSQVTRWIPWVALVLALPAFVFIFVNVIEWAAGNDGGESVFGTTLDPWRGPVNVLLTVGPIAVLLLIGLAGVRIQASRFPRGFDLQIRVRLSWRLLLLGTLCLLIAAGTAAYLLTPNVHLLVPDSWDIW